MEKEEKNQSAISVCTVKKVYKGVKGVFFRASFASQSVLFLTLHSCKCHTQRFQLFPAVINNQVIIVKVGEA